MANGPAIITETYLHNERGGALGKLAMVVSLGLISGPSLGGWLVSEMGWRSIFLINVPIGLIGILLVYIFVPQDNAEPLITPAPDISLGVLAEAPPPVIASGSRDFDYLGSILQSLLLILFILLFEPPNLSVLGGIGLPHTKIFLALALLALIPLFFWVEKRAKDPVFDFSLLNNRTFWTANLASFFLFVAYSAFAVLIPYFFEHILHLSTSKSGQLMTAIPIAIFIVAPISGRLSDFLGSKELCIAGAFILATTLFMLAGVVGKGLHEHVGRAEVLTALCAIGLGMGLFQSPNNNAIMGTVPKHKLSVASALIATIRNLGLFTGVGFGTSLFAWKGQEAGSMVEALHFSFLCAGLAGLGAVFASLGKEKYEK